MTKEGVPRVRIRLMGTQQECREAAARLRTCFDVVEQSAPRPNRGTSDLVRVYLQARMPANTDEGGDSVWEGQS